MRRLLTLGTKALVAVIALVLITTALGGALGTSMGIGYVETESMSPTLTPGDGFLLIPSAVADEPKPGDVVVFEAEELRGGGPTTHRIVGETERGYITQGDNNNAPDQAADEPPVKRAQIAGQVLQVNGHVIALPYVGTVATTVSSVIGALNQRIDVLLWRVTDTSGLSKLQFSYVLTGVFLVLYGVESYRGGSGGRRDDRSRERSKRGDDEFPISAHTILVTLTLVLVVATTAAMAIPGGTQQYDVVASESESPVLVSPGEKTQITHGIGNSPVLPMVVFVEGGDDVQVDRHEFALNRGETANVSATLNVPDSTGHHRFFVVEHRYIAVLPPWMTRALHAQHPWLPVVVINALVAVPYYLIGRQVLPKSKARVRRRHRA